MSGLCEKKPWRLLLALHTGAHGSPMPSSSQMPIPIHRCPFPFTGAHSHSQVPIPIHRCPFPFTGAHGSPIPSSSPNLQLGVTYYTGELGLTSEHTACHSQHTRSITHSTRYLYGGCQWPMMRRESNGGGAAPISTVNPCSSISKGVMEKLETW